MHSFAALDAWCRRLRTTGILIALILLGGLVMSQRLSAATVTWTGGSTTTNNWSDAANWGGTLPVAGDDLVFAGTTRLTPFNDTFAGVSFRSVTFAVGAGNFVLGGAQFTLSGGAAAVANNATSGTMTIGQTLTFSTAAPTIAVVGGGTLVLGAVNNGGLTVTMAVSGTVQANGVITGGGGLVKNGTGEVILGAANTWSGATNIAAGTLRMGFANALPSGGGRGDVAVTGTLDLAGFATGVNGLTGAGTVTTSVAGACTLTVGNNNIGPTFNGFIQDGAGTVALTKVGTGTMIINTAQTYTGATTINGGVLRVVGSLAVGSAVTVATGTTLEGTGTVAGTVTVNGTGAISPGTGGTTYSTLTTGAITYAAATGVTRIDLDGSTPRTDLITSTGTVSLGGSTLTIASVLSSPKGRSFTIISAASVTGTFANLADGGLVLAGGRGFRVNYTATTVTLTDITSVWDGGGSDDLWTTAANWVDDIAPSAGDWLTFAGITRLTPVNDFAAGTAFGGIAFAAGSGDFSLSGNALVLTGGANALSSSASVGTMTIANALTFSTVAPTITSTASGTLVLGGTVDNGGLAVTVAAGGPVTINGVLSGAGGLTKSGTAVLTLAAANTYTGATAVNAGTLRVTGSTVAASAVSVANAATLEGSGTVAGTITLVSGGTISPGTAGMVATLTTGNVNLVAGAVTRIDLDGVLPSNDRITSSGTVVLTGSTLTLNGITNAVKGQVYTIVSATTVTGTFTGLANNAILVTAGRSFRIAYTATTVTLTDTAAIWDGGGADDQWTTAANWVGDVAPAAGDMLIFAGSTRLTPNNDYVGGSFAGITFAVGAGDFVLSGNALTLTGGGTLALTDNATSGTMTIGNALTFSAASTITTTASGALVITGTIANGGTLVTVAAGGPVTCSAAISGTGGLTKTGAATLTLAGVNTYTGATAISAGTLRVTGSTIAGSAVSVANGAVLEGSGTVFGPITTVSGSIIAPGAASPVAVLSTANVTLVAGAVLRVDIDGSLAPPADRITSTGTVALGANVATLTINSAANTTKNQTVTIVSGTSVTGTFLNLPNNAIVFAGTKAYRITYAATTVTLTDVGVVWDGGGSDNNWTTAANWVGDVAPVAGDALVFAGVTRLTPSNDYVATTFSGIAFAVGAGDFVLSGNAVTLTSGTTALASYATSGTMTVSNNLVFSTVAPTITTAVGGSLVISGAIDNGGLLTTVTAGGPVTISGVVSGAGGLTKTGVDTLTLSANNTYGGATTISAGYLKMGIANALPSGAGKGDITVAGILDLNGFATAINGLAGAGGVTSTNAATLTVGNGSTATNHTGVISGPVSLIKVGGAVTQTISGANTWSGSVTVTAGTLQLGNAAALPSGGGRGDVTVNGTLNLAGQSASINALNGSGTVTNSGAACSLNTGNSNSSGTFSGVIQNGAGAVALIKNGTGTQVLSGASTYTGTTTINAGVLRITGSLGGTGVVTINGGTLEGSGTLAGAVTLTTGGIAPGTGGNTINTLTTGAVSCAAGGSLTVDLDGAGPTADRLTSTGAVALNGTLTIASNNAGGAGKVYTIVSGTSVTGTFTGLANGATVTGGGRSFTINYTATTVTLTDVPSPYEWDGGGADDRWSTAANWVGDAVPPAGSSLVFAGNTRLTPQNDLTGVAFASVTFSPGAGNFTLTGDPITLSGGSAALSCGATSGTMTITAPLVFTTTAPTLTTVAGGTLVLGGTIETGGMIVTIANAGPVTVSGGITGLGSLTKLSGGTLTLSGLSASSSANFQGDLVVDAGSLVVGSNTVLAGGLYLGASSSSNNTATVDLSAANLTVTSLTARQNSPSSSTITIGSGRTLTTTGSVTIGNTVSAANTSLTVSGAGTWAVNAPAGTFSVGGYNPVTTNLSNQASLDLSGLTTFTCDVTTGSVFIGRFGDNATRSGFMNLAASSTINAATLTIGESASGSPVYLRMGSGATIFNVDTLNIGTGGRDSGSLTFAGGTGTLQLRNRAGTGRAAINMQTGNITTGYNTTNVLDLNGHTVDLLVSSLIVGGQGRTGWVVNTINFNTGVFDVTTIRLGERTNNVAAGTTHASTLNIGGGTVTVGNGGLQLAANTHTGTTANLLTATVNISGGTVTIADNPTIGAAIRLAHNTAASGGTTANGVLNLTGGTLTVAGNIILGSTTRPATGVVNLAGGTLNVGGYAIGSAIAGVTFAVQSGALSNLVELNGGGAFTKSTSGTVTLGGTNTWSGATTVAGGTLLLNSATALPSGTGKGDLTVNGVLDLNGFNTAINGLNGSGTITSGVAGAITLTDGLGDASGSFAGVIQNGSGTVSLVKTGTGTQVLTGTNTYSGTTSIQQGALRVNGATAATSAVTVNGGTLEGTGTVAGTVTLTSGTLAPGNGGTTVGTLTTGAASFAAGMGMVVNLDGSALLGERLVSTGAVSLGGALTIATTTNAALGAVHTIVSGGSVTGTFTGLPNGTLFAGGGRVFLITYTATDVTLTETGSVWDGGGADDLWSNPLNWSGDVVPPAGSHLVFAGNTRLTPYNDLTGVVFSSLSFAQNAGNFVISGDPITLNGGGTTIGNGASSGTMTIAAPVVFTTAAPSIVTIAGGTLVLSGAIDNGGMTVTAANEGPLTISGALNGSGSLTKGGSGTLTMSGAGSYSGGTLIRRGDVLVASSGGAVTGPFGIGTVTIDSGTNAARVLLQGGQTVSNALVMTTLSPGSGLGALQQTGAGVATWSGPITLNANATTGGHFVGGSSAANALRLSGLLTSGGSLTLTRHRAGFVIYAGSGGTLPVLGISGTAQWGADAALPAGVTLQLATGVLTGETGTVDLNGFNQTVAGLTFQNLAGGIVTTGAGTLTLAGDISATFTGTPDAGVNTIAGNLNLGGATRTVTVADSAAASDLTITAVVANGALTKAGTGTLVVGGTAANTYTGTTTVGAGVLQLAKTAGVNAVAGDLAITGGAVTFAASNQIADTATVTMSGTTSVFNGTAANTNAFADYTETFAALTMTGGAFNCGLTATAPMITITGATSITGGGNTIFIGQSGTRFSTGSLTLVNMTATAGGTVATNSSFTIYGAHPTIASVLTIGSGGLTLTGASRVNMRRGGAGQQGSRLVLNGDVTATSGTSQIVEDGSGGTAGLINLELSGIAGATTRTMTVNTGAVLDVNLPIINGAATPGNLTKAGAGQLNLGGGTLANAFTGVTTVAAGRLGLNKSAITPAIVGNLVITGGQVTLPSNTPSNQIADTVTVTMSGATSVFNGTVGVNQGVANVSETIGSLIVTGGNFNAGGTSNWTITGLFSMTGGNNTIFVGNSGTRVSAGSLSLTAMTATAGATIATNDSFTVYGAQTTQSVLTVGAGGLTLNGSVLNLRRGAAGNLGSKLVLNGPITTAGTTTSTIREDTAGGTIGTYAIELSSTAGAASRTITTIAGADLTISVPITNGAATPGSLVKSGAGALTTTATNTWSGSTTVAQGTLYLVGTQATTAVMVDAGATLGGSGTIAGTVALTGTIAPGTGGTTTGQLNTGALTWVTGGGFTVDLNGTGPVVDSLTTAGQPLAIDGPLTVSSLINETVGQTFTILTAATITGGFTNAPTEGSVVTVGAGGRAMSVSYATPGVVTLTCVPKPTVTAIAPDNGPDSAQTPVTITGTLFDPAATVLIDGNPATSVVWVNSTTITAVTPTGTQGLADVTVVNPGINTGTLVDGYAYTGAVPTVTSVSPANGPALATTPVTITGTNFFPGTPLAVQVGGVAATAVTYVNSTTITATFPAMASTSTDATPDVVVTIGDRQQATLANGFTYDLRPVDDATGAVSSQLAYRYHRLPAGSTGVLPDFTSMIPFLFGTRADPTIGVNSNPIEGRTTNWAMEFGGYVTVPTDGVYTFTTRSDDGSKLFIGTTEVVNNNFSQGATNRSGQIALTAGVHRLRVEYAQGGGGNEMSVLWQGPTFASVIIPSASYSCDPAPTITSLSPNTGPQGGGTAVTISGTNFVAGSMVVIGGVLATSPVVIDANTIVATTPGGTLGAKDVLVIGPRSTGATLVGGFTYSSSPAPTLTAITPNNGPAIGGTAVTLTVTNVPSTPTVTFNGVAATSVVRVDATTVTCVTPAMPSTDVTADVTVTVGGQSATMTNGFTWTGLRTPENPGGTQAGLYYGYYRVGGPLIPTFSSQTPFSTGIRNTVTVVAGTNPFEARNDNWSVRYLGYLTVPSDGVYTLFTASDDGSRLYIGSTMVVDNNFAQGVTERSGQIALAAGTHLLTIEFAQGTGGFGMSASWQGPGLPKASIPDIAYTTDPTPTVTSLDVTSGPQSGGTAVTITGTGFTSGATVTFGGTTAIGITVSNSTTITCTTPSHALGTVAVVVANPTGLSGTLANAFTYTASAGPTITSISPTSGPSDGGTAVTVTGTGFGAPMTVTFGGVAASNVTVNSSTQMTLTTPAMQGATLTVDVTVTNGAAQSATLVGGFTYTLRVPENPTAVEAGLTYRYHRVAGPLLPTFTGLTPYAIGVRNTPVITVGNPGAANPFDAGYNTNWSVEYRGYITVPTDNIYTFFTESDDGSQLLIGSGVVVANNFAQGMTERSGSIGLQAGTHQMTIRFAQGTGNFGLNVRWQSSTITKAIIPNNVLWTDATPTITSVTPNTGTNAGGTTVTIVGTGFTSGTTVTFGGTAATSVVPAGNGLSLTAVTPAHAIGPVAVAVANGNGLSVTQNNAYTYQGSAPVITAVSPIGGPLAGGTTILIYGNNFAAGATVTVGGVAATNVSVGSGVISARTPAGTQGPAAVVVTNIDGTSGTLSPGFYYQGPAPTIATISPANGPMAGGTTVTITGTNFTAGATVTFDGVAAATTTVVNSTTISVTTAAGAQGPADVVVTNNDLRTATRTNGFMFEGPPPTVTAVAPTSGPMAGGTSVTITGTNFAAGATVAFDGVAATGVTVVNATTITATTPAGAQGFADITVTNVDLLNDTLAAAYIFLGAPPVVSGISPTAVPINYTTTDITISGTGFAAGVTVTIQGQPAVIVSVSSTAIVVNLPGSGLAPGPAPVVVTNVDLQTTTFNGFIIQGPAPILTGIDVPHGPVAGGRRMTLTGSAFRAGAIVTLGGVPATIQSLTATTIVVITPAHDDGAVTVTVTNDDLLASSLVNAYTYYKHDDNSTAGNGCGTGGGLTVLLFLTFLMVGGGFSRRR